MLAVAGGLAPGCTEGGNTFNGQPGGDGRTVAIRVAGFESEGEGTDGDALPQTLRACRFEEGRMVSVFEASGTSEGERGFRIDRKAGRLYVLAGDEGMPDLKALCEAGVSESEWLATTVGLERGTPVRFFSGMVDLAAAENPVAELRRGTARLDLRIRVVGEASVERLTLEGVASNTPLFPDARFVPERGEVTVDFETPKTEDTPGVARIYEEGAGGGVLRAEAVVNGKHCRLEAELPVPILRNRIYVVTLRKDVAEQEATLTVEPWQEGGDVELHPDFGGAVTVDAAASELPADAVVDEDGRGIRLSHRAAEFVLTVRAGDDLELQPVEGGTVEVEPLAATGAEQVGVHRFHVRKLLFAPGMEAEETLLRFRRKGFDEVYPEDRIALHLSPNPTRLEGLISFAAGRYDYAFGRYVDNELGRFTLPEGVTLSVTFAEGEDPWAKVVPAEEGGRVFRLLGGWRPNDPKADGREQVATLVIADDADGGLREEYRVSRRNWGLPVTWFHGVWWCKYNARGESRRFEDQILSSDDPAVKAGKSLFDYLRDCSAEEFVSLWGWAYQGGSGVGMKVVDQGGKLVLEGFSKSEKVHINKLPAEALAPDGYALPTMEESCRMFDATGQVWLMWDGEHTLRTPWEGRTMVKREQRRRNGVAVGSVTMSDLLYLKMWSKGDMEHEPVVWYGPGAQWDESGIKHAHYNNLLIGICSPERGEGWFFNGNMNGLYLQRNGGSAVDTRILRFKKLPVEYIYGL